MNTVKVLWCVYLQQFVNEQPSEHGLAACDHKWIEIEQVSL